MHATKARTTDSLQTHSAEPSVGRSAWRAAAIILLLAGAAMADETQTTKSPEEIRLAELELMNKIAQERYGTGPTQKAGDITGGDQLAAMALLMLPEAHDTLAELIATRIEAAPRRPADSSGRSNQGGAWIVASRKDFGTFISAARHVQTQVDALIAEGKAIEAAGRSLTSEPATDKFGSVTLASSLAMLGAVDSIIGLFRTDYTVSSVDVDANLIGLQLAIARRLGPKTDIDGLVLGETPETGFRKKLEELDTLRLTLASWERDKNPRAGAFVDAVTATLTSLRTLGADGASSAARIERLLALASGNRPVLYVDIVAPKGTAITTRRLFSLNRKAHLYATGLVNYVAQDTNSELLASGTLRMGASATLNLRDLEKTSNNPMVIVTDEAPKPPQEGN